MLSDQAVFLITNDPDQIDLISSFKGLLFIVVTSLLLAYMMRHYFARQETASEESKTNEERLKFALEGAGDGVWVLDIPSLTTLEGNAGLL